MEGLYSLCFTLFDTSLWYFVENDCMLIIQPNHRKGILVPPSPFTIPRQLLDYRAVIYRLLVTGIYNPSLIGHFSSLSKFITTFIWKYTVVA